MAAWRKGGCRDVVAGSAGGWGGGLGEGDWGGGRARRA